MTRALRVAATIACALAVAVGGEASPTAGADPTLAGLVAARDRAGIRSWAEPRSVAALDAAVAALTPRQRATLADVVLDTDATAAQRKRILAAMRQVLDQPHLGFYAEVWSYTTISLSGGGFYGGCNDVWLSPAAFDALPGPSDVRGLVMHESFHSFNCVNGGPSGALDEGAAIWITQVPFADVRYPGASFAETTYGTKLFYREIMVPHQPDYPLGSFRPRRARAARRLRVAGLSRSFAPAVEQRQPPRPLL